MNAERIREFLLRLPLVEETAQWGNNLVFWVGDKSIGGKMFALLNLDEDGQALFSFSAGPELYHELLENEGVVPAPYLARIHWIALQRWNALPATELLELVSAARDLTYEKLPRRTKEVLELSPPELRKTVAQQKKLLAQKAKEKAAARADIHAETKTSKSKVPTKKAVRPAERSR